MTRNFVSLTVFFFIGYTLNAQFIRFVQPEKNLLFSEITPTDTLFDYLIKIESKSRINGDSIFYQYRMLDPDTVPATLPGTGMTCASILDTAWFGTKAIRKQNGDYVFFNRNMDSIYFKQYMGIGGLWRLMSLDNGDYIEAEVMSLNTVPLWGSNDYQAVVKLVYRNYQGAIVPHPVTNQTIGLSSTYGFSRIPAFYFLPDSLAVFDLAGYGSEKKGVYDPGTTDLFDYDIGDEFHYEKIITQEIDDKILEYTTYAKKIILDKTIYATYIVYEDSIHEATHYVNDLISGIIDSTSIQSYLNYTVVELNHDFPHPQQIAPGTNFLPFRYWIAGNENFNGRIIKRGMALGGSLNGNTICGNNEYPGIFFQDYALGLGVVKDYRSSHDIYGGYFEKLLYYKKGQETWGYPLSPWQLSVSKAKIGQSDLSIYPNPSRGPITVQFKSGEKETLYTLTLHDLFGRQLQKKAFRGEFKTVMEVQSLPKGLYFLGIKADNGEKISRKVILN